jgi:hypothetical protein
LPAGSLKPRFRNAEYFHQDTLSHAREPCDRAKNRDRKEFYTEMSENKPVLLVKIHSLVCYNSCHSKESGGQDEHPRDVDDSRRNAKKLC